MKKIIFYIIIPGMILLPSCSRKLDYAFDKPSFEREQEVIAHLKKNLINSDGWVADVYTKSSEGKAYSFYFEFKNDNRVAMMSDIDATTATTPNESSYKLRSLQQPTLSFDTYNYLHRLSDPMPDAWGGNGGLDNEAGKGLISDFEFGLKGETVDSLKKMPEKVSTLHTTGRYNSLPVTFRKATSEEAAYWKSGKINDLKTKVETLSASGHQLFQFSDKVKAEMSIGFVDKKITYVWMEGAEEVKTASSPFTFEMNELRLKDTIFVGTNKIKTIAYADVPNHFSAILLNGESKNSTVSAKPVLPAHLSFGYDKPNKGILIASGTNQPSASFTEAFNSAQNKLVAIRRSINSVSVGFSTNTPAEESTHFTLRINYKSGLYTFNAEYYYLYTRNGNEITLNDVIISTENSNAKTGSIRSDEFSPLYNFFKSKTFIIDYYEDGRLGLFEKGKEAENFVLGTPLTRFAL